MTAIERMKLRLRFGLWAPLRANRHPSYHLSHSQFGEDMVARALLQQVQRGTYVDVGAHHPVYFSNTYHFYCRGWRGLNIDANSGMKQLFDLLRPGDINVEACVAATSGKIVEFCEFEQPALNTIEPITAETRQRDGARLLRRRKMTTVALTELLERHLSGRSIDLMSIDLEGLDQQILESHDFDRWRVRVLIFERDGLEIEQIPADPLVRRLRSVGYAVRGKCGPSLIMSL